MAGQISYQISFDGIDKEISKLEEVNNLLNKINSKGGLNKLNNAFNGSNGVKGGSNIVPLPSGGASAAAAEGALAGALINNVINKPKKSIEDLHNLTKEFIKIYGKPPSAPPKDLTEDEMRKRDDAFHKRMDEFEQSGLKRDPADNPNRWKGTGFPGVDNPNIKKPPIIPPPFPNTFMGVLRDGLSKFRNIISGTSPGGMFGILRGLGSIANGSGGLRGVFSIFGGLAKLAPVLVPALLALGVAFIGLRLGVKLLTEGIREGAEAYRNAASAGKNINGTFAANSAFKALGIGNVDLSQIAGNGQLTSQQILAAAQSGRLGNQNQLLNMAQQFNFLMRDAAQNAREMESASKASFLISMEAGRLQREWKTLLAQLAESIGPELIIVMETFIDQLKTINFILEAWKKYSLEGFIMRQFTKEAGVTDEGFHNYAGKSQVPTTSLEKLGFVFNGPKPQQQLSEISRNTGNTVNAINTLTRLLSNPSRDGFLESSLPMLPSLP